MESNKRPTQCGRIMSYLDRFGSITQREADEAYGIKRLPSRISEMRDDGMEFVTVTETGKNRFGEPCSWTRYFPKKPDVIGYARIKDRWEEYTAYSEWVAEHAPNYYSAYNAYKREKLCNGQACEILCKGKHGDGINADRMIYLVRTKNGVYLIGEEGLTKITAK